MNGRLLNSILFIIPALIWGSTWYVIKFQLGSVNPIMSVGYRFLAAGLILYLICRLFRYNLRFTAKEHGLFYLLGVCLFGINYWLVYAAEQYLTSGLIAVLFSLIVFTNTLLSALLLKTKITWQVIMGGLLAITGTTFIFWNEITVMFTQSSITSAIVMGLVAVVLASFGNVLSAYNQKRELPVIQANAYGMLYGSATVLAIGVIKGAGLTFDTSTSYVLSLIYLSVFGSIIAFTAYLKLIGRIGAPKASYIVVIVPVIAMIFSTIFESYQWQRSALVGMPVLVMGNLIALNRFGINKIFMKWK
jgi:drug/metabolite transporter (DMT)-like permease